MMPNFNIYFMKKVPFILILGLMILLVSCQSTKHSRTLVPLPAGVTAPLLIGGERALYSIMNYPHEAKENGVDGRVIILFKVTTEGKVKNARAAEGRRLGYGLEAEARRVVRLAKFEPATNAAGEPVEVEFFLAIKFKLVGR